MRTSLLLASTFFTAILGAAATARADEQFSGRPVGGLEARAEGNRVGFSADLWITRSLVVAGMGVSGQIEVHPNFALDFDVPWAAGNFETLFGQRTASAGFGNITLGGHGIIKIGREAALNIGATVSIPTRYDFQGASIAWGAVMLAADATRGYYDLHRLYPGVLFVRFPIGAEVRFAKYFHYRGELNPVILTSVAKNTDHAVQVLLEHADELEARAPFGLGGGLRFQAVFALSDFGTNVVTGSGQGFGGGDRAQTALEPFIQYEPRGAGVYARLGLLVALDSRLGFGFDRDKLATIRMGVGGKF